MVDAGNELKRHGDRSYDHDSTDESTAGGKSNGREPQAIALRDWIMMIIAAASALAAAASAFTAHKAYGIAELQMSQEIDRTSFSTVILDKESWSIRMVQVSGKDIPLDTVRLVPAYFDDSGVTFIGTSVYKSVVPAEDTSEHAYDIIDARTALCRAQKASTECPAIFSVEIHYSVLGEKKVNTVR